MPVIGRLDEQVNDILITPLEPPRDREPAPDEPPPPTPTDETPPGETSPPRAELPVWLL
jgi:hypothetical protein